MTAGKDEAAASAIYAKEMPSSRCRSRTRSWAATKIQEFRSAYPAALDFDRGAAVGSGDLWVNEYVIRYDGKPSYAIGVMEFSQGRVVRETIYVTDGWDPPEWRAQWVEPMDE